MWVAEFLRYQIYRIYTHTTSLNMILLYSSSLISFLYRLAPTWWTQVFRVQQLRQQDGSVSQQNIVTVIIGFLTSLSSINPNFHYRGIEAPGERLSVCVIRVCVSHRRVNHNVPADLVVPWQRWWGARSRPVTLRRGRSLRWPGPGAAGRFSPPPRPAGTELGTEPCGPRCSPTWLLTWRTAPCSPTALQRRRREKIQESGAKRIFLMTPKYMYIFFVELK